MHQRAPFAQGTGMGPEQLSALLDSVRELVAILSPDGTIQFASAGFTRLLGYPSEGLAGTAIVDLLHADDADEVRERLRRLSASGGAAFGGRCQLRSTAGCGRWLDAAPTHHANQAVIW